MKDNTDTINDRSKDDDRLLNLLKDAYLQYHAAEKEIIKRGMIIQSGQRLFTNPAIIVKRDQQSAIIKILKLLRVKNADTEVENWIAKLKS